MRRFSKDLVESLTQAVEFARGNKAGARVHVVQVPDVRAIRRRLHMSQHAFADAFRIPETGIIPKRHHQAGGTTSVQSDGRVGGAPMLAQPLFEAGCQLRFCRLSLWRRVVGLANSDFQKEITEMLGPEKSVMVTPPSR